MKNDKIRDDALVPLTGGDLTVLAWFAAWTPEIHKLDWKHRRRYPPGYRDITDVSTYGNHHEKAREDQSYPPVFKNEPKRGFTTGPTLAKSHIIPKLLRYRMLEGTWGCARLTGRGRAALKLNGMECPDFFESHDKSTIFDDHDLRPQKGINFRTEWSDETMGRIPDVYKDTRHKEHLPDDETTWKLWLAEYSERDYMGWSSVNRCSARLSVSSGLTALNGSLRTHSRFPSMTITDEHGREIVDLWLSFEQLAELLVSNGTTPVTVTSFFDRDGMRQDQRVPDPVSISRRVQERVKRSAQDAHGWIHGAIKMLDKAKMGKKARAEIIDKLELAIRDTGGLGAFAAQQAMEEVSMVGESMLTIMTERVGDNPQLLGGDMTLDRLLDPPEPGGTLVLEHTPQPEDSGVNEEQLRDWKGMGTPQTDHSIHVEGDKPKKGYVEILEEGEVRAERKLVDGVLMQLVKEVGDVRKPVQAEHWITVEVWAECLSQLVEVDEGDRHDNIKLIAAFLKGSSDLNWPEALAVVEELNVDMLYGDRD